jgi:hypothetical protein
MFSGLAHGATLLAEKSCYEEIGYYDEGLPRYTDWDWLIEYSKRYSLLTIPAPLARVRKQGRASAVKVEISAQRFVQKHAADFAAFGFYGSRALGKRWLEVAEYYYSEGNNRKGNEYLKKTVLQNPIQRPSMYLRIVDHLLGTSMHGTIAKWIRIWEKQRKQRS